MPGDTQVRRLATIVAIDVYQPFSDRAASAERVASEADRALGLDTQNVDAALAKIFLVPPFGRFGDEIPLIERLRTLPSIGAGQRYAGWYWRNLGWIRASLDEAERAYRLDILNPMAANLAALARMAAGCVEGAVPIFEDLMVRVPGMSFSAANLM